MPKPPSDTTERAVARAGACIALGLVGIVVAATISNAHHPSADPGETAIAGAVSTADPGRGAGYGGSPFMSSPTASPALFHPTLVTQASGDPLLSAGFGHLAVTGRYAYGNLAVFPVYSAAFGASHAHLPGYALLGEAMSNGAVTVSEPNEGGSPSRTAPGGLTVPAASITNAEEGAGLTGTAAIMVTDAGTQPTYAPDGEVVPGGNQDQGVATDTVVPARSANVSVASFCVEQGRSSGPSPLFRKDVALAIPSVRFAMQVTGQQGSVWSAVSAAIGHFNARTGSDAYYGLEQSSDAQEAAAPYADSLTLPVQDAAGGHPVGVVVAINGKIVCADVYRDPALFHRLWPALLHSYALQAAMTSDRAGQTVDATAASKWLTQMDSAPGAQTRHADLTHVARVATSAGAGVRTAARSGLNGDPMTLLHEAFWTPDAALTN